MAAMKSIYLLNFNTYHASIEGGLMFERVGKLPIVKVTRQWGNFPFWEYFRALVLSRIAYWCNVRANGFYYGLNVISGWEKDVTWNQRADGLYEPADTLFGETMPHLAQAQPPEPRWKKEKTKKRRKA